MTIRPHCIPLALVAAAALAPSLLAQSLSTPVSNNGTGGVFMNLTPGATPLLLTGLATQSAAAVGQVYNVEVWTRSGTYAGFTGSNAGWTLSQTIAMTGAGSTTNSAPVVLPVQISLPASTTTAVYIHSISANAGIRFAGVSATPPTTTWGNGDIALVSDFARTGAVAFAGSTSTPRCFAGTIFYVPANPADSGACCSLSGACSIASPTDCNTAAGLYQGPATVCSPTPCPVVGSCCTTSGTCTSVIQSACIGATTWNANVACGVPCPTGACCLANGTCTTNYASTCITLGGFHAGENSTCPAVPCNPDVEPNNTRSEAPILNLNPGDMIRGHTTGAAVTSGSTLDTTADYFHIRTAAAPLGIYRYRMLLASDTPSFAPVLVGLTQTPAGAGAWPGAVGTATSTESNGQSNFATGGVQTNTWYGFGKQEELFYKVTGGATTIATYSSTLERTTITPQDIGSFVAGTLTIVSTNFVSPPVADTAYRVFDSNLNPIPGFANDDASTNGGAPANANATTSFLRRAFTPGVYYIAASIGEISTNQGSPCDDNTRNGTMMDFPNIAVNIGGSTLTDATFNLNDGTDHTIAVSRPIRNDIAWLRLTVSPAVITGACCAGDGSCSLLSNTDCFALTDAVYQGNSTTCVSSPCQTGACCRPDATCIASFPSPCNTAGGLHLGASVACPALPCLIEVEPNSIKFEATLISIASGQTLRGRSTGGVTTAQTSTLDTVDTFLLQTPAATPGIYRHTITLAGASISHSATIRGLTQSPSLPGTWPCTVGNPTGVDTTAQLSLVSGTDRLNTWYGFGRQELVYYRISGNLTSSTDPYAATLQTTPIVPTDIGTFNAGTIVITTGNSGHNNDTALRVYDATFTPIEGSSNDNAAFNGGSPADSNTLSFLQRAYGPGTYYLAITIGDLATNQGAPCDDNDRSGTMIDFADAAVDSDTSTETNVSFIVYDGTGYTFPATRGGPREIAWFRFTVADSGLCCRGSTCTLAVPQSACTSSGTAGAAFVSAAACNAGSTSSPCCYADYNKLNGLTVQDIFDFLADWFAGNPYANTGGTGAPATLSVQNIFEFLSAWFAGGC